MLVQKFAIRSHLIDCHVILTGPGDIQMAGLVLDRTHVFMEIIVEGWGLVRVVVVVVVVV